jgi:hypothetical protein
MKNHLKYRGRIDYDLKKNKFNSHVHFKLSVTLLVLFVLFERTRWMQWKRYTLDWSHLIRTMNNRGRLHYTYCFFIDLIIRYKNAYVFHSHHFDVVEVLREKSGSFVLLNHLICFHDTVTFVFNIKRKHRDISIVAQMYQTKTFLIELIISQVLLVLPKTLIWNKMKIEIE